MYFVLPTNPQCLSWKHPSVWKMSLDKLFRKCSVVLQQITARKTLYLQILSLTGAPVYFTHPYTSCEKGDIKNHNGLIHLFQPKGKRIDSYDEDTILGVELWANGLPRKPLGYRTPDEAFEAEIDRIFAVRSCPVSSLACGSLLDWAETSSKIRPLTNGMLILLLQFAFCFLSFISTRTGNAYTLFAASLYHVCDQSVNLHFWNGIQ